MGKLQQEPWGSSASWKQKMTDFLAERYNCSNMSKVPDMFLKVGIAKYCKLQLSSCQRTWTIKVALFFALDCPVFFVLFVTSNVYQQIGFHDSPIISFINRRMSEIIGESWKPIC